MRIHLPILAAAAALALAGCSDGGRDNQTTSSVEKVDRAPQVDTDPTPDTGTGGASQTVSPDSTVNGAPDQPKPSQ